MKFLPKLLVIFLAFGLQNAYSDQIYQEKLTEKNLLHSALTNYPKILAIYEKVAVKEGGVLEKEGYFDIRLNQKYGGKARGYYDGKEFDIALEKQNALLGSKIYGGFRKSYGNYADYDGNFRTNSGGEYRVGASFSLLQNRAIDKGRLDLINSKLELKESKIQLENIKIEIQRDALKSYWKWVIDGEILKIHQQLLELAEKRNEQLKIRVSKGDVAQITLIENERNILNRRSSTLEAKRDFESSAIYLSLFYRDSQGNPEIPDFKALPSLKTLPEKISKTKKLKDLEYALEKRPELRILRVQKEQELNNLAQGQNLLSPKLDIGLENSKDLGNGPKSRSQTNNSVKLNFEMPLQRSEGKGKVIKAESMIEALKLEEQLLKEKIDVELSQIQVAINNAVEVFLNFEKEWEFSKRLEAAEKERFKQGGSDFFLVNLREQEVAKAKISQLKAFENYQEMLANYRTASFDLAEN